MGTCNNGRIYNNSSQQISGHLWISNVMQYQEMWCRKKSDIYIITDGEPDLTAACLKCFSKCSLLRCTRHFEANCKDFLIDMGIKGKMKDAMLDVIFRKHGLVETKYKQDLKEKMNNVITLLSEMEKHWLLLDELLKNKIMSFFRRTSKVRRRQFSGKL